jgi:Domain of unknown function (DUF4863)
MLTQAPGEVERFAQLMAQASDVIGGRALDGDLEDHLNRELPPGGAAFQAIFKACREAVDAGWMCSRSAGGIRFGRVIKPQQQLDRFSVDVVEMESIAGPHHAHPNGEIDMIMPIDATARFDGKGAGWLVYPPASRHSPTVTGGKALILYLLPEGAIDFNVAADR